MSITTGHTGSEALWGRLLASAGDTKGYLGHLCRMPRGHVKTSICDELGWERVGQKSAGIELEELQRTLLVAGERKVLNCRFNVSFTDWQWGGFTPLQLQSQLLCLRFGIIRLKSSICLNFNWENCKVATWQVVHKAASSQMHQCQLLLLIKLLNY